MSLISFVKKIFGLAPSGPDFSKGDRMLTCMDCEKDFVFDAGEQRFFKQKGFTDPKRCPHCRKRVRSRMKRRGRGRDKGHRSHHSYARKHAVIDGDSPYADER